MTERQLQQAILRAFGTRADLRVWRSNCGVARIGRRVVRFGVPGQADLTGILPDGRRLEIEVKGPEGRQSADQRNFQRMIERFGGLYVLARSVQDIELAIAPIVTPRCRICGQPHQRRDTGSNGRMNSGLCKPCFDQENG